MYIVIEYLYRDRGIRSGPSSVSGGSVFTNSNAYYQSSNDPFMESLKGAKKATGSSSNKKPSTSRGPLDKFLDIPDDMSIKSQDDTSSIASSIAYHN